MPIYECIVNNTAPLIVLSKHEQHCLIFVVNEPLQFPIFLKSSSLWEGAVKTMPNPPSYNTIPFIMTASAPGHTRD